MNNLYVVAALAFTLALLVGATRANPELLDWYETYSTGISLGMYLEPEATGKVVYDAESHMVVN